MSQDTNLVSIFLLTIPRPHSHLAHSRLLFHACYLSMLDKALSDRVVSSSYYILCNPQLTSKVRYIFNISGVEAQKERCALFSMLPDHQPSVPYDSSTTSISPTPRCFISLSNGFSVLPLSLVFGTSRSPGFAQCTLTIGRPGRRGRGKSRIRAMSSRNSSISSSTAAIM